MESHGGRFEEQFCIKLEGQGLAISWIKRSLKKPKELSLMYKLQVQDVYCRGDEKKQKRRRDMLA